MFNIRLEVKNTLKRLKFISNKRLAARKTELNKQGQRKIFSNQVMHRVKIKASRLTISGYEVWNRKKDVVEE